MAATPAILLDGHVPSSADLDWLLTSRALAFGEGLFSTLRVFDGQAIFLEDHLHRLQNDLLVLQIPGSVVDFQLLAEEVRQLAASLQVGALKVMLLAGPGGAGYRRGDHPVWHRLIQPRSLSLQPAAYQGVECWYQPSPAEGPVTVSKHLNRLTQVLAATACPAIYPEALHHTAEGWLTEGIARNLFWYAEGCWFTPSLDAGVLAGVMRRQLLALLPTGLLQEGRFTLTALQQAEEVLLCNSLQGIWPVKALFDASGCLGSWPLGEQTRHLMSILHPRMGLPTA